MSKRHHGSCLDSLLEDEGVFEEAQSRAAKEVAVWQLSKAASLKAGRSQVDRLPDPTRIGTNRNK